MTRALLRNLALSLEDIGKAWNKDFTPFQYSISAYSKGFSYNEVDLKLDLPRSDSEAAGPVVTRPSSRIADILRPLTRFNLRCLDITFFDDDAYQQVARSNTLREYSWVHSLILDVMRFRGRDVTLQKNRIRQLRYDVDPSVIQTMRVFQKNRRHILLLETEQGKILRLDEMGFDGRHLADPSIRAIWTRRGS